MEDGQPQSTPMAGAFPSSQAAPSGLVAPPGAGVAPSSARTPWLPGGGLQKPPAKKVAGGRRPVAPPSTTPSPTPTMLSPAPAVLSLAPAAPPSMVGTDGLSDTQEVFDGMPNSEQPYVDMLNEAVGIDEDVVEVEPTPRKKGARSMNYSTQEDEALVFAWESYHLLWGCILKF
ncbi:hypothetical protein ACP4OV_021849 [Aristida adscensionis]